jgi:DNA anti-recombination protein RmuC
MSSEEMYKLMKEIKVHMNKQLTDLKENSIKRMNEIKKTMQYMKEEINEYI